jgi:hypothetical protein
MVHPKGLLVEKGVHSLGGQVERKRAGGVGIVVGKISWLWEY